MSFMRHFQQTWHVDLLATVQHPLVMQILTTWPYPHLQAFATTPTEIWMWCQCLKLNIRSFDICIAVSSLLPQLKIWDLSHNSSLSGLIWLPNDIGIGFCSVYLTDQFLSIENETSATSSWNSSLCGLCLVYRCWLLVTDFWNKILCAACHCTSYIFVCRSSFVDHSSMRLVLYEIFLNFLTVVIS